MSTTADGKLSEQINFGVTEEIMVQAQRVEKSTGLKITQMARSGFIAEINRLANGNDVVPAAIAKTVIEAQRLGVDVKAVLRAATKASLSKI